MLRRLAVADLEAFQAYRHDPELGRYQSWSATSDAEAASWLAEMSRADLLQPGIWSQIGIADAGGRLLIGDIGILLATNGQHAEIGVTLRRPSQGQGLATTAVREAIGLLFEQTTVERVLAITDARNQPSIRLLARLGMRHIASDQAVFRGERCIEYTYAVSRGDIRPAPRSRAANR